MGLSCEFIVRGRFIDRKGGCGVFEVDVFGYFGEFFGD